MEIRKMTVHTYRDGMIAGTVRVSADDAAQIEAGTHPAFQWPEGICRADDFLGYDVIERLGISPAATIYLD